MNETRPRQVLLGVTGAIAAYKAAEVVRGLRRAGVDVQVAMTARAHHFVTPFLLGNLSGRQVITDQYAPELADVRHVPASENAELVLIAPATADFLGKMANGLADDFLSTLLLTATSPVLVAPAMESRMWAHPAVAANVARLGERGVCFVGPVEGELATFHTGLGRMADPADIVDAALRTLAHGRLDGVSIVVSAGRTEEALDPVRVLSNRSSGRMGYALAREAWLRGAAVTLVSGPSELEPPRGVGLVRVRSAEDMRRAVLEAAGGARAVIMCAAVGDFKSAQVASEKLKKEGLSKLSLDLVRTPDILAELGADKRGRLLVGFAAEDRDIEARARRKLEAKGCDLVVANDIARTDVGFGTGDNEVLLVERSATTRIDKASKAEIAARILDKVRDLLAGPA